MNEKKTILVFKTHFDVGYTALAEEVMDNFVVKMLPDVIKTCEQTKHLGDKSYVWTLPSWPLFYAIKSDKLKTGTREKLICLIQERKIIWHALPFTTHTEFCGLEEYIRGMYFSKMLSKEYGYSPLSAKMTDVPGHTWILPSLLNAAGVKFLHLGCNPCSMPPDVPPIFFWEGPDGARVLTFYSKGSYGTSLDPIKGWHFPVWLALMQTNDNMGPQSAEEMDKIIADVQRENFGAEIVTGTLDDFYNEIIKYDLSWLPVLKVDLADSWIHGVGTYPDEVGKLRRFRYVLSETEKLINLFALKYNIGGTDANKCLLKINEAYKQSLLFGEHTWGLDVPESMGKNRHYKKEDFLANKETDLYKRMEESWREQRDKTEAVENILNDSSSYLAELTQRVKYDGEKFILFNGLGWKRSAIVDFSDYREALAGKKLMDVESGNEIKIIDNGFRLFVIVSDLPSLGYKTLTLIDTFDLNNDCRFSDMPVVENRYYRLEADINNGAIISLYDKANKKEWVDNSSYEGLVQYSYDIYGTEDMTEYIRSYVYRFSDWIINDLGRVEYPEIEHRTYFHKEFTVSTQKCEGIKTLIICGIANDESVEEYGNSKKTEMRINIYDDAPYIDFEFSIFEKQETPYIEAGHLAFTLNIKEPEIKINKLGSVVDPSKDVPPGANNTLYCCENWMDISDSDFGVCIIPIDAPLFSIGSKGICKFKNKYEYEGSIIYFNLFNNQWGTNFPQWLGGDYSFRYRMIPHDKNIGEDYLHKKAMEAMCEPLIGYAKQDDGENVISPCGFDFIIFSDRMAVISFKKAEDGRGNIIRLRDLAGEKRETRLIFNNKVKKIVKCSLLEDDICDITNSHELSFDTNPYQIHTFRLI